MPPSSPPAVVIRPARPAEVTALRALVAAVDASTPYLPREPGEWPVWCGGSDPAAALARFQARPNAVVLVAEAGGGLAGWLGATGGGLPATRGTITLALGVAEGWRGRGVGSALLTAARRWAESVGAWRLDLSVVTGNTGAAALYRRHGFHHEGTLRATARVAVMMQDEHILARLLRDPGPVWEPVDAPPAPGGSWGTVTVRPAEPADAAAYGRFRHAMARETPFLLHPPTDGAPCPPPAGPGIVTFAAISQGEVLGAAVVVRGTLARTHHDAAVRLSVRRTAWGNGVGQRLLAAATAWAQAEGVMRLSAWTPVHNRRGRRFAAAAGFAEEAVCTAALRLGGRAAGRVLLGALTGAMPHQ